MKHYEKPIPEDIATAIRSGEALIMRKALGKVKGTLLPEDYESYLAQALEWESKNSVFTEIVLATDVRTLSPELLTAVLHMEINTNSLAGRMFSEDRACDKKLIDAVWPGIDVNTITSQPARRNFRHPCHLLIDVLSLSVEESGGRFSYLFDKLMRDPRLDLPGSVLTTAYAVGMNNYMQRDFKPPHVIVLAKAKNFDPNAQVDDKSLLITLVDQRIYLLILTPESKLSKQTALSLKYIEKIVTHPDFDPYPPHMFNADLVREIHHFKTTYGMSNGDFIQDAAALVERSRRHLNPGIQRHLEEAFKDKIAPDRLVNSDGTLDKAYTIAATANVLPRFMAVDRWAQTIGEAAEYEAALEKFPPKFINQFKEQIEQCQNALADRRTQLNRRAGEGLQGFVSRHTLKRNPRPMEGKG